MELRSEEMDFDLTGRKAKIPKCVNCVYSNGIICKKFNMPKNDLASKGIDIFNCPYYKPNNNQKTIDKLKEMGFSD